VLKLPTAAGDLDLLNGTIGAPPYVDPRKRASGLTRDLLDIAELTDPEGSPVSPIDVTAGRRDFAGNSLFGP